jgi:hypothetical protein
LVESNQPDIIFLQETLGDRPTVVKVLETLFKNWSFAGTDSRGQSGGLEIGWNTHTIKLKNSWEFDSGLGLEICSADLRMVLIVINVYGPYLERMPFWDSLVRKTFMICDSIILGGDLNFSLGAAEVWEPKARANPLSTISLIS